MVVVRVVVVWDQTAEAGCRDVPGKMVYVFLLVARVTLGGRKREREGEQEEERLQQATKQSTSRKCVAARDVLTT